MHWERGDCAFDECGFAFVRHNAHIPQSPGFVVVCTLRHNRGTCGHLHPPADWDRVLPISGRDYTYGRGLCAILFEQSTWSCTAHTKKAPYASHRIALEKSVIGDAPPIPPQVYRLRTAQLTPKPRTRAAAPVRHSAKLHRNCAKGKAHFRDTPFALYLPSRTTCARRGASRLRKRERWGCSKIPSVRNTPSFP